MDELVSTETLDLDQDHFLSLETSRQWPKYVVAWSVRRRSGDSDYPVRSGTIERMPPKSPAELEEMLEALRQEAIAEATEAAAVSTQQSGKAEHSGGSFLSRLFGRR